MNVENILLRERSLSQKDQYCITALHEVTKISFEASLLRTRTCKAEWHLRKWLVPCL